MAFLSHLARIAVCASLLICTSAFAASSPPASIPAPSSGASLDRGFTDAYNLNFNSAQQEFAGWQKQHPADPLGPVSEAAGLLFSELHRLGVLESQLFVKDSAFDARPKLAADPAIHARFEAALLRTQGEAQAALTKNGNDHDALFAMAMVYGLRADYTALIEKRNVASLGYTRDAGHWGDKLLAVAPDYYDGYLASGLGKYIIGSMAAPVRWFLRIGGYAGDKKAGMHDLQITASKGRFLAPFARLLLAVAYLRQNDRGHARVLLAGLRDQFPANPLFAREIARIDSPGN